jgi:hypothetical protein
MYLSVCVSTVFAQLLAANFIVARTRSLWPSQWQPTSVNLCIATDDATHLSCCFMVLFSVLFSCSETVVVELVPD